MFVPDIYLRTTIIPLLPGLTKIKFRKKKEKSTLTCKDVSILHKYQCSISCSHKIFLMEHLIATALLISGKTN